MSKKQSHERALDILKSHDGVLVEVLLKSGQLLQVWNVAWGYDIGDKVAHITSNCSPSIDGKYLGDEFMDGEKPIDLFWADEIVRMTDPDSGAVWYELSDWKD